MYTYMDFKTKKAFKEAVKDGKKIRLYQPNNIFGVSDPENGSFSVEGPHYPKPHTWYASVVVEDGFVVKVS